MSEGVTLTKGGRVNLTKTNPSLKNIRVDIGWKPNKFSTGGTYDMDVTAFMLKHDSKGEPKSISNDHMLFYGSVYRTKDGVTAYKGTGYGDEGMPATPNLEMYHSGDNTSGEGEGPDESIYCNVEKCLSVSDEVSFIVTIHDAKDKKQNFGQISGCFVDIIDVDTNKSIARYDLQDDFSTETAVQVGSLIKKDTNLIFSAVGQGFNTGLIDFCQGYGVGVSG